MYRLISLVSHLCILGIVFYTISTPEIRICAIRSLCITVVPTYVYFLIRRDPIELLPDNRGDALFLAIGTIIYVLLFVYRCKSKLDYCCFIQ